MLNRYVVSALTVMTVLFTQLAWGRLQRPVRKPEPKKIESLSCNGNIPLIDTKTNTRRGTKEEYKAITSFVVLDSSKTCTKINPLCSDVEVITGHKRYVDDEKTTDGTTTVHSGDDVHEVAKVGRYKYAFRVPAVEKGQKPKGDYSIVHIKKDDGKWTWEVVNYNDENTVLSRRKMDTRIIRGTKVQSFDCQPLENPLSNPTGEPTTAEVQSAAAEGAQ